MSKQKKELIICRCEDVTEGEILEVIKNGARTVNDVKRWSRAGRGLCQGRTCRRHVSQILANIQKKHLEDIPPSSFRIPVRPVKLVDL